MRLKTFNKFAFFCAAFASFIRSLYARASFIVNINASKCFMRLGLQIRFTNARIDTQLQLAASSSVVTFNKYKLKMDSPESKIKY